MAQLVLSRVGAAIGGRALSGAVGSVLGRAAGAFVGARIDGALFGADRSAEGPRLTDLHLQGSTEGASIPAAYGRVRLSGEMIWAARFKEHVHVDRRRASGGKGGAVRGPTVTETTYSYTLSFAVGLCEGPATRIQRAWANGEPLDLSTLAWRFHPGTEDQPVDPLIEAIEGADAPAYRGLAYVVFEDFPLERWGNAPPQLSFELARPVPSAAGGRMEDMLGGVCLIPGAGEFVYATDVARRTLAPGVEIAENMHAEAERANLLVSLDQLQGDLPNCQSVMLVISWFGTDLRCGVCDIRPGVEIADKTTRPHAWRAGGVSRAGAHLVSEYAGGPAYGGTPSDASVLQAIAELKARNFRVGLYPFILMDVPPENGLGDPYGGAEQAAYPWRGRITCHPAAGQPGTVDKTAAAGTQAAAFFGAAEAGDFSESGGEIAYSGPAEWSFRRFILHYAALARAAGGVDAFVIGSELRGLTQIRDGASSYPAVAALKALAQDVRDVLDAPETALTYAADWSEYFGHHPQDGSGDVFFHLDPLWSDDAIDCVGVDWYPPLTDWREGAEHADAAGARGPYDPDYLESRIEGGEAFDWFYASGEDRAAQTRTPITDGAYGKPWVFRPKDLRSWWGSVHHDRPGGVESGAPTGWTAQSKPIWLIEFGCPAIDKGANAPNLFFDPKSAESAAPPFSAHEPDDLIQRRTLEAYLRYWSGPANPIAGDGRRMIDMAGAHVWTWDARPFPHFPARLDVWSDGGNWRYGHWLNGRAGAATLAEVVEDVCRRAGMEEIDVSGLTGVVSGYVVDSPASARAALEPLMQVFDFEAAEIGGRIVFAHTGDGAVTALALDALAQEAEGRWGAARADGADAPLEARMRFLDPTRDHHVAMVSARNRSAAGRGVETIDAPLALAPEQARAAAEHRLAVARARMEQLSIALPPSHLALTPGDRVTLAGAEGVFRIAEVEEGPVRRVSLARETPLRAPARSAPTPAPAPPLAVVSAPDFLMLDLPPLIGAEEDGRPVAAVFADPWPGGGDLYAGASAETASWRGRAETAACMGELEWDLWPGPIYRWDTGNAIRVRMRGGALESVDDLALFAGANAFAVEQADGSWEILQAKNAVLVAAGIYDLSMLLRGQMGTEQHMGAPVLAGARIVKLDARLARLSMRGHEIGATLAWAAAPGGRSAIDPVATRVTLPWRHVWARPFAPAHLRALRLSSGDVTLWWNRRTRIGGDSWDTADAPLAEEREAWRVEIRSGASVIRTIETAAPAAVYAAAAQIADFGALPGSLTVRIGQISGVYGVGAEAESTFTL